MAFYSAALLIAAARWVHYDEFPNGDEADYYRTGWGVPIYETGHDRAEHRQVSFAGIPEELRQKVEYPVPLARLGDFVPPFGDNVDPGSMSFGGRHIEVARPIVVRTEQSGDRFGVVTQLDTERGSGAQGPTIRAEIDWDEQLLPERWEVRRAQCLRLTALPPTSSPRCASWVVPVGDAL